MIILNEQIISAGNMASNITSTGIDLNHNDAVSISCIMTGAPVGTLSVQVADSVVSSVGSVPAGDWSTYTSATAAVTAAGVFRFGFPWGIEAHWLQLVYTKTSGTGSLTAELTIMNRSGGQ